MNSLHGYWAGLARLSESWLYPQWWPYWNLGMPFEFTSPPFAPAMTAGIAALRGVPPLMAFETLSAIVYCALPAALFGFAWALTRAPEYSFFAGLLFSLFAPGELLAPEQHFAWAAAAYPKRLMLQALWNETPRFAALAFLLLFLTAMAVSIGNRRAVQGAFAAVALGLAMLASPFAILTALVMVSCLLTARQSEREETAYAAAIGVLACAIVARYLPPSLWAAIAASTAREGWHIGMLKVVAAVAVIWFALAHFLPRSSTDWRIRFLALFAFATSCAPMLSVWLSWRLIPQPHQLRIEMDAALALLAVFGARPLVERLPRVSKVVLALTLLWPAGALIIHQRRLAKDALYPADVTKKIEYRTAQRLARELPGVRVMLPGSIAHWANTFTEVAQFSGSEGSTTYSQMQRRAMTAVYQEDASVSLVWLKAYGAGAVVVSGPPYTQPEKFERLLPALWSEDGVTAYRVPQRTAALAHVVPEAALALRAPENMRYTVDVERYNAALDDGSLPEATLEWAGHNRFRVRAVAAPSQVISIQVSYHPGWRAVINGRAIEVRRDGLGLMWLRPGHAGPFEVDMAYDGGWELRLCGWLSAAGALSVAVVLARGALR